MALGLWHLESGGSSPDKIPRRRMGEQGSARQRHRAGLREDGNRQHGIRRLPSLLARRSSHAALCDPGRDRAHRALARQRRRLLHHRLRLRRRWRLSALVVVAAEKLSRRPTAFQSDMLLAEWSLCCTDQQPGTVNSRPLKLEHPVCGTGAVQLLTRTGLDWMRKYPAIAAGIASLGARQGVR